MRIKVLYFAQLRDIFGCDSQDLNVSEKISVGEVEEVLRRQAGPEKLRGLALNKAVNEEWAADDRILNENDTLVLLPPVSGG